MIALTLPPAQRPVPRGPGPALVLCDAACRSVGRTGTRAGIIRRRSPMTQLLAGAAESVITPPAGIDLAGYAHRPSAAVGKHDDLYCRALVLETTGAETQPSRLALVSVDIIGFQIADADQLRRLVERETGIPAEAVLLNCSHTHAGPATMKLRGLGQRDAIYDALLARWIAGTVRAARDRLEPAALRWGETGARIGRNRREQRPDGRMVIGTNEEGPYDARVPVLRL